MGAGSDGPFNNSINPPRSDREIEEMLSEPTPGAVAAAAQLDGDFIVLGASGKMGVTLAAMTRRALDAAGKKNTRVMGVARFRDAGARAALETFGVEPIACDLTDYEAVMQLPAAANVQYLAGQKFGTDGAPDETWIENTVVPSHVARHFRDARIVVFSTGCVYPFSPAEGPGANEESPLGFLGEYATTCIGRERVFTYYSTPTAENRSGQNGGWSGVGQPSVGGQSGVGQGGKNGDSSSETAPEKRAEGENARPRDGEENAAA